MGHKTSIDTEVRGFYFASSGDDNFDGDTLERPKLTVQAALDAAASLTPTPDLLNPAQVSAAQGGAFVGGFALPGFVNFDAMNATFTANQAVSVTLGDAQICRVFGVRNSNNNSTSFLYDGLSLAGVRALFCQVVGNDSIGFEIKGASDGNFVTCDRLSVIGERSIGVKITGTFSDPLDVDADVILLNGDESVFLDYGPDNATDACVVDVSSVFSFGATVTTSGTSTSTGYIVRSGHLTIKGAMLIADVAIEVKSGAEADMRQETVIGDIVVDSGGVLFADILHHESGTVTNNGEIIGRIGSTFYAPRTFTNKDPDTTALLTHKVTGANGGDSRTFYTTRDPNLNITGNPGDIAIRNDGEDSRAYQHHGSASSNDDWIVLGDSEIEKILDASSFVDQPVNNGDITTDEALQIAFGAAQGSGSDPVQLSAAGAVTINEDGQYGVDVTVQFGRTGSGSSSQIFFRGLVNGAQVGNSIFIEMDNSKVNLATQMDTSAKLTDGDVLTFEFIRDSAGFDSGGLFTDNPTAATWNDSASAHIVVSRQILL